MRILNQIIWKQCDTSEKEVCVMQNYSDEQRDAFFKMIDDMKASDFGVQHFLTHSLDDTMILDTEMLDENTIRLHMGHKTKYGELLVQKGDAVCGFYHKNKENGKGVSATMDISLHEDLHKNAVMADIFCLQAGRFQIQSFIQADEYGANFSMKYIWANDEKEPRLTSMPQLFVDGQFSKGFYNFVRNIVGEVRKAMEICFCDGDYDEMECDEMECDDDI